MFDLGKGRIQVRMTSCERDCRGAWKTGNQRLVVKLGPDCLTQHPPSG